MEHVLGPRQRGRASISPIRELEGRMSPLQRRATAAPRQFGVASATLTRRNNDAVRNALRVNCATRCALL